MQPKLYTSKYIKTPLTSIGDALVMLRKNRTKFTKTECLKEIRTYYAFMNNALKSVFVWAFDDEITTSLPKGDIGFLLSDYDPDNSSTILKEYTNFYYFIDGASNLSQLQKETYFIKMVSKFDANDREVMMALKDKNIYYKFRVTKQIVSEVFPEIKWGGRIQTKKAKEVTKNSTGFDPRIVTNVPVSSNPNLSELEELYSSVY